MNSKEIEFIFSNSNSADELFDAFHIAISEKIRDEELYKKLLWNKALSADEISMFAEKISHDFPELSFNIFFWTAQVFESISNYGEYHNHAFKYFKKSAASDIKWHEPYLTVCRMYNHELNIPDFNHLVEFVKTGINNSELKSVLCFAMADLYYAKGEIKLMRTYSNMGEKFQKEGK